MEDVNWNKYWNEYRTDIKTDDKENLFFQVGKTIDKAPITDDMLEKSIHEIIEQLDLKKDHFLLEMCCGNGLLTKPLSNYCNFIYAFDFTEHLIQAAKKFNAADNIDYQKGDAKKDFLSHFTITERPTKILMCASLGYFSTDELSATLNYLNKNLDNYEFYLTEIPNDDLKWNFYNTDERKKFYYSLLEKKDQTFNGMGKWWNYNEIETIAKANNLKLKITKQNKMYNYRMDVLFQKTQAED